MYNCRDRRLDCPLKINLENAKRAAFLPLTNLYFTIKSRVCQHFCLIKSEKIFIIDFFATFL